MTIWSASFWRTTGELAARSSAQFALIGIGGSAVDAWHLPWKMIAGLAVSGAVVSVLTSLSSDRVGEKGSPLVTAKVGHGWNPVDPLE